MKFDLTEPHHWVSDDSAYTVKPWVDGKDGPIYSLAYKGAHGFGFVIGHFMQADDAFAAAEQHNRYMTSKA
jgi:hypothetical protein